MSWRTTRAAGQGDAVSKQVAVIDLGSNSWRLVVFSYAPGTWWKRTDELYETVRIGAGLGASGRLSDEAIMRGMETLAVFERFCAANGLEGYERLILDAMLGDQALFTSSDGILRLWEISEPLLQNPPAVESYTRGSWGPASVSKLIEPFRWHLPNSG